MKYSILYKLNTIFLSLVFWGILFSDVLSKLILTLNEPAFKSGPSMHLSLCQEYLHYCRLSFNLEYAPLPQRLSPSKTNLKFSLLCWAPLGNMATHNEIFLHTPRTLIFLHHSSDTSNSVLYYELLFWNMCIISSLRTNNKAYISLYTSYGLTNY